MHQVIAKQAGHEKSDTSHEHRGDRLVDVHAIHAKCYPAAIV